MNLEEEDVPQSNDHKIPKFLHLTYCMLLIGGIWGLFMYWNGSHGWLDRGYWKRLQEAAKTTFPFEQKVPYLREERVLQIDQTEKKRGV